jgi:hypothetical protein
MKALHGSATTAFSPTTTAGAARPVITGQVSSDVGATARAAANRA